jgi:Kef-type K+ transport system membrane component KefB
MFPQYLQLFFLGFSILLALLLARGATLLKSPLIVGYILAGAIIGPDVLGLLKPDHIASLDLINLVVLSLIGFGIGGELKIREIKKLGKSILLIVIFEAMGAFLLVSIISSLLLHNVPLGILFGALASASAPAGTVEVIKQYKAKGDFTTTLYAVMGLDDILALFIFTISLPIAVIMLNGSGNSGNTPILHALSGAGLEILLSIAIGTVVGFIMLPITKLIHERVNMLLFSLAVILINCAISEYLKLSPILLNMVMGIIIVNNNSIQSNKIFSALGDWTPPMYVWFFVLIGTRLNVNLIVKYALFIVLYILARSLGKWSGTFIGSSISGASRKIRNYLGLALMSQAGVAIGLALAAADTLENSGFHDAALQLMSAITATTFIVMLIGPIMAKIALFKSGETNISD